MNDQTPQITFLRDYQPSPYLIDRVNLDIALHPTATRVVATLEMRHNPLRSAEMKLESIPLVLDADELTLESIMLNGAVLPQDAYTVTPKSLTLHRPPLRSFRLEIVTIVNPTANTHLMGIYRSGNIYVTQCEAEGFRRITYFLDRPDVMAIYTTRLEAERDDAPILLGNGNLIEQGDVEGTSRHYAIWYDPHPKPAYLFALVGGQLSSIQDTFTTASGHEVKLGIYVETGKEERAHYAMDALIRSMRWDEKAFGREYDLDVFNIVAVPDFNMGAMENKGLNIFNDKYILASPQTATDTDYLNIETIVAHEYFHNWTGNRITCRDWFQLCLKEGLTVFRDQEFTSDERSRAVKRISDVRGLRALQFAEDASPLAHPVRPSAYQEINNFYTATVYEKGAEVIRMLKTLLGDDDFAAGMNLYFTRCDGSAATVEDFITCFADASGLDLDHFMRWYAQSGTPRLIVSGTYDEQAQTYQVDFAQHTAPTSDQQEKIPLVLPIELGLISATGQEMALQPINGGPIRPLEKGGLFVLDRAAARVTFGNVSERPVLSVLRQFSAPVQLDANRSDEDLLTIFQYDHDALSRWEAMQEIALRLIVRTYHGDQDDLRVSALAQALDSFLKNEAHQDHAFAAQVLQIPSESSVMLRLNNDINPDAVYKSRQWLRRSIALVVMPTLLTLYEQLCDAGAYSPDAMSAGRRALRNLVLDFIREGDEATGQALASKQYMNASNMTERFAALSTLSFIAGTHQDEALAHFEKAYGDDPLVMDKWFALQASSPLDDALPRVQKLMAHDAFSITNPNRVRALIGTFAVNNLTQFNRLDGAGYTFVLDQVARLDQHNPHTAVRLLGAFRFWKNMEAPRREKAREQLLRLHKDQGLSRDVSDILQRALV